MAKAKKFGAFAGVFTPSLLTILGVIMYMRLGWVVGQAGLYSAIAIVLFAHVISVFTGLSISSIATDKRIKTGGIYYILSRSLGLPMGGAIGLTLAVGTALSISLYIIGFCESFLPIIGLETSLMNYRLIGTAVIMLLVTIAFISTSLAIKSQFLILAAIALSLVSIAIGFYTNMGNAPEVPNLLPAEGVDVFEVFKIFFPAVTGFTAGVAMSGDLQDPKRTIPIGTMAAIATGMVVYLGLTLGFGFFVDRNLLLNDTNFLTSSAWQGIIFVTAGVWLATLSSALGGILGGPRILQAIALDKIMPSWIGKGYGAGNEPRMALLVIFGIAEVGILIAELDTIAGIVSMFYLASYGFINIAFFFESWASADFRPSFRVSRWFGLVGALACFGMMLQLDPLAMMIALLSMGFLFFVLKRRELQLDFGDVWQSVWTRIIRTALQRMDDKEIEERNWQPNVLLFSGGTSKRPHLIEFGKFLVGKHGILSNFDLHEVNKGRFKFAKHEQSVKNEEDTGIFTRRHTVHDIYQGIETIAGTYGFSGVEPNTVLMGWGRNSSNPKRFVQLLMSLYALDMNVLIVDYDKERGYGKNQQIDIWWRGAGNHGNLALTLARFMRGSEVWQEARLRLLIVNQRNEESDIIQKKAEDVLDSLRLDAEVRILNNEIEQKPFYDIVRLESINADIIFLGIPDIDHGQEAGFVKETDRLVRDIGTTVLIKASSHFKELKFGTSVKLIKPQTPVKPQVVGGPNVDLFRFEPLAFPANNLLALELRNMSDRLSVVVQGFYEKHICSLFLYYDDLLQVFEVLTTKSFKNIDGLMNDPDSDRVQKLIDKIENNFLIHSRKTIAEYQEEYLQVQQDVMIAGADELLARVEHLLDEIPLLLRVNYNLRDLKVLDGDRFATRFFKSRRRLVVWLTGHPSRYTVRLRKLIGMLLLGKQPAILLLAYRHWGMASLAITTGLKKQVKATRQSFHVLHNASDRGSLSPELLETEREKVRQGIVLLKQQAMQRKEELHAALYQGFMEVMESICLHLHTVNANKGVHAFNNKAHKEQLAFNVELPGKWRANQSLHNNLFLVELLLVSFENRLRRIFTDSQRDILHLLEQAIKIKLRALDDYLVRFAAELEQDPKAKFMPEQALEQYVAEDIGLHLVAVMDSVQKSLKMALEKFPETVEILSDESINDFMELQYDEVEVVEISAARLLEYIIQDELIAPLQKMVDALPAKLERSGAVGKDVARLIAFSIYQSDGSLILNNDNSVAEAIQFVNEQRVKLHKEMDAMDVLAEGLKVQIEQQLTAMFNKLTMYSFTKLAANFKQYVKEQESSRRFSRIKNEYNKVQGFVGSMVDQMWYRQSQAVLLAQSIAEKEASKTGVNALLDLAESVAPNQLALERVPFFYRQLFLSKHNYNNEFWFGRDKELEQAQKSIGRYQAGYHGGIMVTGDHNSGKTFFSQYITRYLNNAEVHVVVPPHQGSIDLAEFAKALELSLGMQGSYAEMFGKLNKNTVLIIDDLQLWWEKSEGGFVVVEEIVGLIEQFGSQCLFILNAHDISYDCMNRIRKIDDYFLNRLRLLPFNAEKIRDAVLFRHRSSGLQFKLRNKDEAQFRSVDYANLFAKYFTYSKGNIGVALQAWMSNIVSYENEVLLIKTPKAPDLSVFDHLETETYILILQFMLHKRLTLERLLRITLEPEAELLTHLNYMKRSGLVVEDKNQVYKLNGFIDIHMKSKLQELEML